MTTVDLLQRLAEIAKDTADYEWQGDYGYGGEVGDTQRVGNWYEIVETVIAAYEQERSSVAPHHTLPNPG